MELNHISSFRCPTITVSAIALLMFGCGGSDEPNPTYMVSGTVEGLTGQGLVIQNNGRDNLQVNQAGKFTFTDPLESKQNYEVTVLTQPSNPKQKCIVSDGKGAIASTHVSSVMVTCTSEPDTPTIALNYDIKTFDLSWQEDQLAQTYKVWIDQDGEGNAFEYKMWGDEITENSISIEVPLYNYIGASFKVDACNQFGCSQSQEQFVSEDLKEAIGYFKASQHDETYLFGSDVAISGDGETLVVSSWNLVTIFSKSPDSNWEHQQEISYDAAGGAGKVAISSDGLTLAATAISNGGVDLYIRNDSGWVKQTNIQPTNSDIDKNFGSDLSFSSDGNILAIGADGGDPILDSRSNEFVYPGTGAVYIMSRNNSEWQQTAYLTASESSGYDNFGSSIALSHQGDVLIVGAPKENMKSEEYDDGYEITEHDYYLGRVYIFTFANDHWTEEFIFERDSDPLLYDAASLHLGHSVAISGDGDVIAIGEPGDYGYMFHNQEGTIFILEKIADKWQATHSLTEDRNSDLGQSLSLSKDGKTLVATNPNDDTLQSGVYKERSGKSGGAEADVGAAYVYKINSNDEWYKYATLQAKAVNKYDSFGSVVAIAEDGSVVIGSHDESSGATGINGDATDNSEEYAGAVYLY
ncbi:FG-GAP repeat protein [Alteromonas ponticola]|uniref:Integrin n=1 Tax=Alteromonas ponticola TaxID=2720613 RepID=A0ABX1R158_9ALTE|nr:FG-GAP repeat protein [Alteromonas ponticola]NMH60197.1 hypothetical protein [Alteromonas ponticola]